MSKVKFHLDKRVLIGFFLVTGILVALSVYAFISTQRLIQTASLLSNGTRVISLAQRSLSLAADIETGERGFTITGMDEYLEPSHLASDSITSLLSILRESVSKRPRQLRRVDTLTQLIERKIKWGERVIKTRRNSFEEAQTLVQTMRGKQIMDSIRIMVAAIHKEEQIYFQSHNTIGRNHLRQFQTAFIGFLVISILIVIILFYSINRTIKSRTETEKKMRDASDNAHDLYDNAPCGYFSLDADLRFKEINKTLLNWLGYERNEVVGKMHFSDFLPPGNVKDQFLVNIRERLENFKSKGFTNNIEYAFLRKDNSVLQTLLSSVARYDHKGEFTGSRTTVFDNSEHLAAEQRFRGLLESAPDAIIISGEDGVIQLVNRQTERIFGYNRDELIGSKIEKLIPKRFHDTHPGNRTNYFANPKVRSMGIGLELFGKKKDDSEFPVEISLSPLETEEGVLVSAAIRDISDRKMADKKFRDLLEAAPDAMIITNNKGIIQFINKQTEKIFDYSQQELLGKEVEVLIPERFHPQHPAHRTSYFNSPKVRGMGFGLELYGRKKDGSEFPVEISLSPLETEEGILVSAAIRDITDRKIGEEKVMQLNKELESFTYSVSHDLRAPLRSVAGYAQILEEDYGAQLDDEGKKLIRIITNNAGRMGKLIDDLLNFSRLRHKGMTATKVDMKALVSDVLGEMKTDGISISVGTILPAGGDANMLRQVWYNLISNAVKYSQKSPAPKVEIGSQKKNGDAIFYVKDNGVGFDMQYYHKLFGVFQRLHSNQEFEGTGVGLALVKRIVERHQGKIWAEAKLNEGATFYFSIPISKPENK